MLAIGQRVIMLVTTAGQGRIFPPPCKGYQEIVFHASRLSKAVILDTDFGFLGLVFQASKVLHLSLGPTSPSHVRRAIADYPNLDGSASVCREADLQNRAISHLVGQLHRYTEGEEQEFRGVHLDLTGQSPFARRVTAACRKIPYGQTAAYGTLAGRAGSPRGARSVGTVMAKKIGRAHVRTPVTHKSRMPAWA